MIRQRVAACARAAGRRGCHGPPPACRLTPYAPPGLCYAFAKTDGKNKLYFGDNRKILRDYVEDASVDLIYLDPPFNSSATYNVLFKKDVAQDPLSGSSSVSRRADHGLFCSAAL